MRAVEFSSSRQGDSPLLPELLAQIPLEGTIGMVTADALTTRAVAMAPSSIEVPTQSYRSDALAVPGKKTASLLPRETRSCRRPGIWGERSGRSRQAITSEVG